MVVAGIVAEYNPFHFGHLRLINSLKSAGATHIAVVMSGNFVQRGEPALLSKWARAKQAVLCGADLVVELPLPWSVAGAEKFAFGGISVLNSLGADAVGFGSECGDISKLQFASEALFSSSLHEKIRKELNAGTTFAAARQSAVEGLFGKDTADLLRHPNNILGIEYLKAIKKLGSNIKPITIKRTGAAHDAVGPNFGTPSSLMIRQMAKNNSGYEKYMPESAYTILRHEIETGHAPASLSFIERGILAKLRMMQKSDFLNLPDISEGLENRVYASVRRASTLDELYSLVKTKRYTHARIRRIILSAFLGINSSISAGAPPYIRVLGIGKNGAGILRKTKNGSALPVVTRYSDIRKLGKRAADTLELESRATDIFALCLPKAAHCGLDMTAKIITADGSSI